MEINKSDVIYLFRTCFKKTIQTDHVYPRKPILGQIKCGKRLNFYDLPYLFFNVGSLSVSISIFWSLSQGIPIHLRKSDLNGN